MSFNIGDTVIYSGREIDIPWVGKVIDIDKDKDIAIKFNDAPSDARVGTYTLHDCGGVDTERKSLWFSSLKRESYILSCIHLKHIENAQIINLEE